MDTTRAASKATAIYSVYFSTVDGASIMADRAVTDLKLTENKNELAQKVTISLINCKNGDNLLSELINVRDRVYIYANDGETCKEVFRGYIWRKRYRNNKKKLITLTCYDNLIYLQKSEDSRYYPAGYTTEAIFNDICWAWGVDLKYEYESITHKKLPLSGKISDMFENDLLDKVKKNTGIKYVIRSIEDVIYVNRYGSNVNDTVYELNRGENAVSTESDVTMEDVVTKVLLTGKADDSGAVPITDSLEGDTEKWGTLQRVISDDSEDDSSDEDEEDSLYENAHDEAQYLLDEYGEPKETFVISAINNPWIRKGDVVKICAGDMNYRYIVTSITHNAVSKLMELDLELADESKLTSGTSTASTAGSTEAGRALDLSGAPIYVSSDASSAAAYVSGTYYLYDGKEISGRYRITNSTENVGRTPVGTYVTGWLPSEYV